MRKLPHSLAAYSLAIAVVVTALVSVTARAAEETFDVVLNGGRVMDPESGLDATRHIGIRGDSIAAISPEPLTGRVVLDVSGLVVAPGFIDLHAHGQSNDASEFQVHDGVTTALELETGMPLIAGFIESRKGRALINHGASVAHGMNRTFVLPQHSELAARLSKELHQREMTIEDYVALMASAYDPLNPEELHRLAGVMSQGLREGALGIGMEHQYFPGAGRDEIFRVFQMASQWRAPIFTHVRSMGVDGMQEVIANATATGASLHIVHVNSSSLGKLPLVLEMIEGAQRRGLDITTEAYPYTAASTGLESAIFDPGWQESLDISYGDIQWQDSGERLNEQTFNAYRQSGGVVIIHMMKPEWIELAMATPFVMVASDGMPYAPGAHPRSAGTFSRLLGYYVREKGVLDLMTALKKITLMPAQRLEDIAPQMKDKGRIRVGADADITVFNAGTVIDTATFEEDLSFSEGIQHVLVNGTLVVRDGATVSGAMPGRAVLGRYLTEPLPAPEPLH
jgi:dihydroorotase